MDAGTLHTAISEVCPTAATKVDKPNDRSTWSFKPKPEATQAQIDAGQNVIATIPADPKPKLGSADFVGRFTNAEYRAAVAAAWRQVGGNAKNWDVVIFDLNVDLNTKKVNTLKTSLVTDGILTQARADEIFK